MVAVRSIARRRNPKARAAARLELHAGQPVAVVQAVWVLRPSACGPSNIWIARSSRMRAKPSWAARKASPLSPELRRVGKPA